GILEKIRLYLIKKLLPHLEDRRKYHQEFASSTSFHGVHNIVQTRSKTRKVLWLLVVAGCLAVVIWQICSRFIYYFSWPTTTTVVVQYVENVKFPAVTFCNLNSFGGKCKYCTFICNTTFSFETAFTKHLLEKLNKGKKKNQTKTVVHLLHCDSLMKLQVIFLPYFPLLKDFEHVFTEYGNCFTFNHNDLPARRVSLSGRGLHLLFDVQQEKFTDEPALGYTDAGITFVIHSPKELPRFDGLGLLTPVGTHAQVAIRQLKSIIQEYPWGECKPDIKLQYHEIYSTNGCLQECKARYIQDWCGCLPFVLPG
ncbi:ASIC5 protein, partial [Dromas ardeola]|nr:ASIC5 protein [Dromas ardeola]